MALRKAVDNLCLYDPGFAASGAKFLADLGGSSASEAIGSYKDLLNAVASYTNVKFLEIILHGSPGMIHFADNGVMVGQHLGSIAVGVPFLKPNARILFDSCDIGRGERGDAFMDELGARLFVGRGGIIGATTVSNVVVMSKSFFCSDVYMDPLSGGLLKVRRYDTNGALVGERVVDRYGTAQ